MATVVNIQNGKTNLSNLVKRAAAGEEIVIANRGKPVAMLTNLPGKRKDLPWAVFRDRIRMAPDFDALLKVFKDYV
jgi:prevent-host-death family protein